METSSSAGRPTDWTDPDTAFSPGARRAARRLPMAIDARSVAGGRSNTNGILEAGETVQVATAWKNAHASSVSLSGTASDLTGPAGPTYTLVDSPPRTTGRSSPGGTGNCFFATGNCFQMSVSGTRPAQHWDTAFDETLSYNAFTRVASPSTSAAASRTSSLDQSTSMPSSKTSSTTASPAAAPPGIVPATTSTRPADGGLSPEGAVRRGASSRSPATGRPSPTSPRRTPFAPWIEELAPRGRHGRLRERPVLSGQPP